MGWSQRQILHFVARFVCWRKNKRCFSSCSLIPWRQPWYFTHKILMNTDFGVQHSVCLVPQCLAVSGIRKQKFKTWPWNWNTPAGCVWRTYTFMRQLCLDTCLGERSWLPQRDKWALEVKLCMWHHMTSAHHVNIHIDYWTLNSMSGWSRSWLLCINIDHQERFKSIQCWAGRSVGFIGWKA